MNENQITNKLPYHNKNKMNKNHDNAKNKKKERSVVNKCRVYIQRK